MSSDNATRQQAEIAFNSVKENNPNLVVEALLGQITTSTEESFRSFSSILLRQVLRPLSASVNNLTPHSIITLKIALLASLQNEPRPYIKRQISLAVALLASKEHKEWPELFNFVFTAVAPNMDRSMQHVAFFLLGKLSEYADESLTSYGSHLLSW